MQSRNLNYAGVALAAVLLASGSAARAGRLLTTHQLWALEYASVVGTSYYGESLPADYQYERTLQAVLITESSLCRHKCGIDHLAYGCGQLHHATAHLVDDSPVSVRMLKRNDAFNIRLAARYLSYCLRKMSSWERGVVCYNKGPYGARAMSDAQVAADDYLKAVRRRMHEADQLASNIDAGAAAAKPSSGQ